MKRSITLLLILCLTQIIYAGDGDQRTTIRSSIVVQNWQIDGIDDGITEGTIPIEMIMPIKDNVNLQISHSPAISRFGDTELSGLSDTWIRGTYAFSEDKLMISGGIGLPTGKTDLNSDETMLSSLLGKNVFKFRLPVFGQGFTMSGGIMYAQPLNDKFVFGGGANFVYQGKYKYLDFDFDPGEQIGLNIGFDYNHSSSTKFSFDVLYNYYMKDKIEKAEHNTSPQIGAKSRFIYNDKKKVIFIAGKIRYKGKSETIFGTSLYPDSMNSNITQLELDAFYRIKLNPKLSFDVLVVARSYIENEYHIGQADIYEAGLRSNIQLRPNLSLNILIKQAIGDGYFNQTVEKFSGKEFQIGSTIKL